VTRHTPKIETENGKSAGWQLTGFFMRPTVNPALPPGTYALMTGIEGTPNDDVLLSVDAPGKVDIATVGPDEWGFASPLNMTVRDIVAHAQDGVIYFRISGAPANLADKKVEVVFKFRDAGSIKLSTVVKPLAKPEETAPPPVSPPPEEKK